MKQLVLLLFLFACLKLEAQTGLTSFKIYNGAGAAYPSMFTEFKGKLYFFANDSIHGYELWCVDTSLGAKLVSDLNAGKKDGVAFKTSLVTDYQHLATATDASNNQYLFFPGYSAGDSFELFKYDGISSPTKAFSFHPGSAAVYTNSMVGIGTKVFFGDSHLGGAIDTLWMYDAVANTKKFVYYPVGNATLVAYHNKLYFYDGSAVATNAKLFCYDPAMDTVGLVKNFGHYAMNCLKVAANKLYIGMPTAMYVYDDQLGIEPQVVPGTDAGFNSMSYKDHWNIEEFKGKIYYPAWAGGGSSVIGLGEYDPTNGNVTKYFNAAEVSCFTVYGGKLYFQAGGGQGYFESNKDTTHGAELWEYDGVNPPKMVIDIWPGMIGTTVPISSAPYYLTGFNDGVYFTALSATTARDLFKYVPASNSVQSVNFVGGVKLYPNPANNIATIEVTIPESMTIGVVLRGIDGKELLHTYKSIYHSGKNTIPLDVRNMPTGTYFYTLIDENGKLLYSGKAIKE